MGRHTRARSTSAGRVAATARRPPNLPRRATRTREPTPSCSRPLGRNQRLNVLPLILQSPAGACVPPATARCGLPPEDHCAFASRRSGKELVNESHSRRWYCGLTASLIASALFVTAGCGDSGKGGSGVTSVETVTSSTTTRSPVTASTSTTCLLAMTNLAGATATSTVTVDVVAVLEIRDFSAMKNFVATGQSTRATPRHCRTAWCWSQATSASSRP